MSDCQIFISYRREGGEALAGRLSDRLSALGYNVFFDLETMHAGKFNAQIVEAIKNCEDMLLVLPPNALERCANKEDWVRQEIELAIQYKKNIIPLMMKNFRFPDNLPPEIEGIRYMEGIIVANEYFDAMISKIESYLSCRKEDGCADRFCEGNLIDKRYKIIRKLGHGATGEIYLANDVQLDILVAVKRMREQNFVDYQEVKRRAKQEFDIQKSCVHSGLSVTRGYFETEDEFCIIMDYIEGKSLDVLISEQEEIQEKDILKWAIQICDALNYLHGRENPLYLNDIKPSNIIIRDNGDAVLIDFGASKEEQIVHDFETTALGTVGYAAPEQYAGKSDSRTDIYNLGMTLHHALTGKSPLEPPYETMLVRMMRPELSKELEKIIQRCVERNPENRYQTAKELKEAFEHVLVKRQKKTSWIQRILRG